VPTRADGRDISLEGDFAYISGDEWGLQVVDIRDPASPRVVGAVETPGYCVGSDLAGGYVYIADQGGGLMIAPMHCQPTIFPPRRIESSCAVDMARLSWWPNPARTASTVRFDLPQPALVTLEIVDLGGRRIRRLHEGPFHAGMHQQIWNGRDDQGHPVPSGVYFVRLNWDDHLQTQRLTYLR
jgi:hypothetical protein